MQIKHQPKNDESTAAFTRNDLLAVVVIVMLLAVVQLHAVGQTRIRPVRERCMSNLKQLDLAMLMYTNDNNGNFPVSSLGASWPWDIPWNVGNQLCLSNNMPSTTCYCPGTSVRFKDSDNAALFAFAPSSFHVMGYAFTLLGNGSLASTNYNKTIIPPFMNLGPLTVPPEPVAKRVLIADATISAAGQYNSLQRYTYNYTAIAGGFALPHLTAHLNGMFPAGGNLAMLDGHVEWRQFQDMVNRTVPGSVPGFWW